MKSKCFSGVFLILYIFANPVIASDTVRIAAIFAKTGIAATENAPYLQMVELAVDEINGRGGLLDRPVELIVLDNHSTPIGSSMAAKEAIRLGVTAVIGAAWSSHSLAMASVLQQAKVPMITPVSTNPRVTRIGNYIFRVCFTDSSQGTGMAMFAHSVLGARTAIVLKIINEEYSLTLAEFFANAFRRYGGRILFDGSYRNKAVDFADILDVVKTLGPDVVFVPGYPRDSGLLIKQAVSMGIQTIFLGGDGLHQIHDFGGDAVEGSFYTTHWHPDVSSEKSRYLQRLYNEKYRKNIVSMNAPLAYDAVMLLADAIDRAESLERAEIRNALEQTAAFQGVTGDITFDDHGDPLSKNIIIMKLGKRDQEYFKTIRPE